MVPRTPPPPRTAVPLVPELPHVRSGFRQNRGGTGRLHSGNALPQFPLLAQADVSNLGHYVINLDSDWEGLPWMLQRVVHYFDETPEADAVTGMFLRCEDSRVFVRVRQGRRLVSPYDVASLPTIPDCIAGVRRRVIDAWLGKSHQYFALEAHAWLTFSLSYSQLYVDEPWALYHTDASNRVTPLLAKKDLRQINDCLLFFDDYDNVLRTIPRDDIDRMLTGITKVFLSNLHWTGLRKSLSYMKIRKMNVRKVFIKMIVSGAWSKLRRLVRKGQKMDETVWIG